MPCASSHFSFDAARAKPSKLPRGCRPWPPQLAAENSGTLIFDHTGGAGAVKGVVERMRENLAAEIGAVLRKLLLGQRLRPAHELAVDRRAAAAFAGAVLHGLDLHVVPVLPERRENAAVTRHVAEPVGRALPDAHRRKVRRLQRGDVPLVDPVIGDAVEPDLAVRPRLRARPFDAVVEILGLARRKMVDHAGRAAAAAGIDAHAGIVVRHPFLGVDHLPVLVLVGRAGGDVGMLARPCAARRSDSLPGRRGPWHRGRS